MKIIPHIIPALALLIGALEAEEFSSFSDCLLPKELVMKISPPQFTSARPFAPLRDHDFHIAQHDSNTAIIWVAQGQGAREEYLCGAICALDQENADLQAIVNGKCKMITSWASSPRQGDLASSIPHRQIDWELVGADQSEEKWKIVGVHKKQNVPVNYLIKQGNDSRWITKKQALEFSLEGKLEVSLP